MAGKERFAVLLEVAFIFIEHAVKPGEQLLCAVIGVQDDGDAIRRGDASDIVGACNGTRN